MGRILFAALVLAGSVGCPSPKGKVTGGADFSEDEAVVRRSIVGEMGGEENVQFVKWGPHHRFSEDDVAAYHTVFPDLQEGDSFVRVVGKGNADGEWQDFDILCRVRRGRPVPHSNRIPNQFGDNWWTTIVGH